MEVWECLPLQVGTTTGLVVSGGGTVLHGASMLRMSHSLLMGVLLLVMVRWLYRPGRRRSRPGCSMLWGRLSRMLRLSGRTWRLGH